MVIFPILVLKINTCNKLCMTLRDALGKYWNVAGRHGTRIYIILAFVVCFLVYWNTEVHWFTVLLLSLLKRARLSQFFSVFHCCVFSCVIALKIFILNKVFLHTLLPNWRFIILITNTARTPLGVRWQRFPFPMNPLKTPRGPKNVVPLKLFFLFAFQSWSLITELCLLLKIPSQEIWKDSCTSVQMLLIIQIKH